MPPTLFEKIIRKIVAIIVIGIIILCFSITAGAIVYWQFPDQYNMAYGMAYEQWKLAQLQYIQLRKERCDNCGGTMDVVDGVMKCSCDGFSVKRIEDVDRVQYNMANVADDDYTRTQRLASMTSSPAYSDVLVDDYSSSLLMDVVTDDMKGNHAEYLKNNLTTPGASRMVEKDNFNPPNRWHGLKRDALHAQMGALGDARQTQSETHDQVKYLSDRGNHYLL